jgi:hypothetical protein
MLMRPGESGEHRMSTTDPDNPVVEEPLAGLERQFIAEYLANAGFDYHALITQHDDAARKLLAEAALYASERLSEIESRSLYLHKLHGEQ